MEVMKKLLLFIILALSYLQSHANEEVLMSYAYNFPLLICYSDEYRACYKGIEVEQCAIEIKKHREICITRLEGSDLNSAVIGMAKCLVTSHAGGESFAEISDPCIREKGMNINITKNSQKIREADPKWVEQVLK